MSSSKQISLLRQQLTAQAQAWWDARVHDESDETATEQVEEPVRSESLPVIDMVDDASVHS